MRMYFIKLDALHFQRDLPSSTFKFNDLMLYLCIYTTSIGQDNLLNQLYESTFSSHQSFSRVLSLSRLHL